MSEIIIPAQLEHLNTTLRSPRSIDRYVSADKPLLFRSEEYELMLSVNQPAAKQPQYWLEGPRGSARLYPSQAALLAASVHHRVLPVYQLARIEEVKRMKVKDLTQLVNTAYQKVTYRSSNIITATRPGGFVALSDVQDEELKFRTNHFVRNITEFIDAAVGTMEVDPRLMVRLQTEEGKLTLYKQALLSYYSLYRSYFKYEGIQDGIFLPVSENEEKNLEKLLRQNGYCNIHDVIGRHYTLHKSLPFLRRVNYDKQQYFLLSGVNEDFIRSSQRFDQEIYRSHTPVAVNTETGSFIMLADDPVSPSTLTRLYFRPTDGDTIAIELTPTESQIAFYIISNGGFVTHTMFARDTEGQPDKGVLSKLNAKVRSIVGQDLMQTIPTEGVGIVGLDLNVARAKTYLNIYTAMKKSKSLPAVQIGYHKKLINFVPENLSKAQGLVKPFLVCEELSDPEIIILSANAGILFRELINANGWLTTDNGSGMRWDDLKQVAASYNHRVQNTHAPKVKIRTNEIVWQDSKAITNLSSAQELLADLDAQVPSIPDHLSPLREAHPNLHDVYAQLPLLTASQERQLLYLAKGGDQTAVAILLQRNIKLVKHIARNFTELDLPLLDLIQVGWIGLLESVIDFDLTRKSRLSTFAYRRIQAAMHRFAQAEIHRVKIPTGLTEKIVSYRKIAREQGLSINNPEHYKQLAQLLGFSMKRLLSFKNKLQTVEELSYTSIEYVSDDDRGYHERLADPSSDIELTGTATDIKQILNGLSQNEQFLLLTRLNLEGDGPRSFEEVGRICGLSKQTASNQYRRIIARLRQTPFVQNLREDLEK